MMQAGEYYRRNSVRLNIDRRARYASNAEVTKRRVKLWSRANRELVNENKRWGRRWRKLARVLDVPPEFAREVIVELRRLLGDVDEVRSSSSELGAC